MTASQQTTGAHSYPPRSHDSWKPGIIMTMYTYVADNKRIQRIGNTREYKRMQENTRRCKLCHRVMYVYLPIEQS